MLRKVLLRLIILLALSLLALGLYSGFDHDGSARLYDNARLMADKAKLRLGLGPNWEDEDWDEIVDATPHLARLAAGEKSFEWSQWLDLDKTKMYDSGDLDPKLYPYLSSLNYKDLPAMPYEKKTSPQEQAMIARLYCKWFLTSPFRVVPLYNQIHSSDGTVETEDQPADPAANNLLTSNRSLRVAPMVQYEVMHENPELRHRQHAHTQPTEYYEASEPLVADLKKPAGELAPEDLLFPKLDGRLFTWQLDEIVKNYNESREDHVLSIKKGNDDAANSEKYFHEVWMKDDPAGYGVHYDWRFFRGIFPHDEHVSSLHSLSRAWQQFAESVGLTYWYAHGSLLGHLWNGIAMPWDSDHDIQMPILELDRLARDFNRTLVVQDPAEGHRKYLIDVSPYYAERVHGNGKNVIDARFVDVDTGVYIDITGLARTDPVRKMASCKNRHSYRVEAFDRIRRSKFEGYPTFVPIEATKMLSREYRSYNRPEFGKWKYNFRIRMWEYTETCEDYLKQFKSSNHVYCYPSEYRKDDSCMDEYETCDWVSIRDYERTKDVTQEHVDELSALENIAPADKDIDWSAHKDLVNRLIGLIGTYHSPFHNSTTLEVDSAAVSHD